MASLKFILVFGVLAVSLKFVRAVFMDDSTKIHEALMPFISVCSKEYTFSDVDIQAARESGTTVELDPCFLRCVFKKSKVINDKGMFDTIKGAEMIKNYLSDVDDQNKALNIISSCKTVNERDVSDGDKGCERAGFLFQCLIAHKGMFIH